MLKIEAIKSTWDTLCREDQLSLLTDLKFRTLGLCQETVGNIIHESRHILQVCGPLSYREYNIVFQEYVEAMGNVISGNILVEYECGERVSINMSTKIEGRFEINHTNNFDWEETKSFTKNEFLNFCYGENVSWIKLDGKPLALAPFLNFEKNKIIY